MISERGTPAMSKKDDGTGRTHNRAPGTAPRVATRALTRGYATSGASDSARRRRTVEAR